MTVRFFAALLVASQCLIVQADMLTVVAFGDSITLARRQDEANRWPAILERLLQDIVKNAASDTEVRVINSGIGGDTSREGLARFEKDVLKHDPDIVLIEFGGNDATTDADRNVPLSEFRTNCEAMIDRIEVNPDAKIVLLTFPPIIDAWHGWSRDPFFKEHGGPDAYVEQYRKITRILAEERGLGLVDIDATLRQAVADGATKQFIRPDGIHLTAEGNLIVAAAIADELLPDLKH